MKIEPMNLYVILKPIEPEETTKSGLHIPDSADRERPQEGEVVAVPETFINFYGTDIPSNLKVGDRVLYGKYNGEDVKVDGEEYKIVEISHIRAKIIR
jgi:chaperonin GroES